MACPLLGAKPLSEPMLPYYQLDAMVDVSTEFYLKIDSFHSIKCIWKWRLPNSGHFVSSSMCQGQFSVISTTWSTLLAANERRGYLCGSNWLSVCQQDVNTLKGPGFQRHEGPDLIRRFLSEYKLLMTSNKGSISFIIFKPYRKTSNISRTLAGNKIVDNSDVVGASPVGAAPTTSSFST